MDFSISHFWSTHLVGGCSFYMSNITCLSYFFKKKIFSITIPCSWKNHGNIHLTHFNHIQETLYLSAFQDFLLIKTFHRRKLENVPKRYCKSANFAEPTVLVTLKQKYGFRPFCWPYYCPDVKKTARFP